jgi:hypothetical protein
MPSVEPQGDRDLCFGIDVEPEMPLRFPRDGVSENLLSPT